MQLIVKVFIINLLVSYFAIAQLSFDGTYKTSGSEAGRATLTISNNATVVHVSYINNNYTQFSFDGTLQAPINNTYKSNETLGCGSPTEKSQKTLELHTERTLAEKRINLTFKYCDNGSPKSVMKTFVIPVEKKKNY